MALWRPVFLLLVSAICPLACCGDQGAGRDLVELKIALPKGDVYMRGGSDPVADLNVDVSLVNKSPKENLVKTTTTVNVVGRLTTEEVGRLKGMSQAEKDELLKKKVTTRDIEEMPVNENSIGFAYVEPALGPLDTIEFTITKLPEEGETVPEGAKPNIISRDYPSDRASRIVAQPNKYLPAGETSPAYSLAVGKYYLIHSPGTYSIKAQISSIGDTNSVTRSVISNEEKFRVVAFKVVDQRFEDLQKSLEDYERGYPGFDYMLYQVKSEAAYDEVVALQRVVSRGVDHWEWTRICTVKAGTQAQAAQLSSKKMALAALQFKGDVGLYKLDFSAAGIKIESQTLPAKEGAAPKLKVEGGNVSVE